MQIRSLGWEDLLEQEMATHSCLKNSMDRGARRATVHGGHKELDMTEYTHTHDRYRYFILFSIIGYCKLLDIVPCVIQ